MRVCKMKTIILIIILTAVNADLEWDQFKATYQRQYASIEEETKRFKIFTDNIAKIKAHNRLYARGEVTYTKRINKFGDMTGQEFLKFVNSTKPNVTQLPEGKRHVISREPREVQVDWRYENAVTPVRDENGCGSSWAIAALGSLEGQLALNTSTLTSLSVQNLIDCSHDQGNGGCTGGFIETAYDYIQEIGVESENDYPYESSDGTCRFNSSKSVAKVSGYASAYTEYELADAVFRVGPVASVIYASEALQFYYGGVFYDEQCFSNVEELNHAILVVGYGIEYHFDYYIAKNSWGEDWGENGYYKPIMFYGNNCGIGTRAVYPIL